MTAAFILGINLFIAAIFAVAFAVVATTVRNAEGAKWIALGYATGIADIVFEYLLPYQSNPEPLGIGIFLTYLAAMTFCIVGVARHYRFAPPWTGMAVIWGISVLLIPWTFSLPYGSALRVALLQMPYFALQMLVLLALIRSGHRQRLDMLLAGVMSVAAAIYFLRPAIATLTQLSGAPQDYLTSTYAIISQSLGAGTLIAQALVMLLIMMRDTTAEIVATSETDALSGVFNRRGFDAHGRRALSRVEMGGVLIAADLDHFKQINDSYGHAAGDGVIAHFAAILRDAAPDGAIVGRVGGEEFAVFLPDALLSDGRLYAETVRARFSARQLPVLGVDRCFTASFGVAQLLPGDSLTDLLNRADAALYRAKAGGRNRVRVALGELPPAPAIGVA